MTTINSGKKYKDQPHEGTGEQTKQAVSERKLAFRQMELYERVSEFYGL